MPTIAVEVPEEIAKMLTSQARALLLSRRAYVRWLLTVVAENSRKGATDQASFLIGSALTTENTMPVVGATSSGVGQPMLDIHKVPS